MTLLLRIMKSSVDTTRVRFYGSFAARNGDLVISGNTMTDQYYYGIYVYYGDNIEISDNELSDFRSNFAYGIYPYQVDGCQITGNHMSGCVLRYLRLLLV